MRAGYFCLVKLQLPQSSPNAEETRFGHEDASGSRGWSEVDGARNVRRHRGGSTAPSSSSISSYGSLKLVQMVASAGFHADGFLE